MLVTISGTLAVHMFVPALPDAAAAFAVSPAAMQLTISVYIVGVAAGQLVYGPLSDAVGRRPMLLAGLGLYTAAGFGAAFASGLHAFVLLRLLQALGGCAGLALGRAIVRDTNRPDEAVRALASMNLMMTAGPGLAPIIGSTLIAAFGWRSVFVALASLGFFTLACAWKKVAETGRPTGELGFRPVLRDYSALLRSRTFMGYAIGGGLASTAVYAFITAAPFIYTVQLHRSLREAGVFIGLLVVGVFCGNALTRRLAGRHSSQRLLYAGKGLSIVAALLFLALVAADALSVPALLCVMFVFTLGAGMTSPAALGSALQVDGRLVGSAAGLYGCVQMLCGALSAALAGWGDHPAWSSACVLLLVSVVGLGSFRWAVTPLQR
jgi:DHA1 family bicyclomycin/chloramphenicol resistance-like MFS transporter